MPTEFVIAAALLLLAPTAALHRYASLYSYHGATHEDALRGACLVGMMTMILEIIVIILQLLTTT